MKNARRPTERLLVALICGVLMSAPPAAAPAAPTTADESLPPNLESSVTRGLAWLARKQKNDGSFEATDYKVAMTGLSLLSFLASGNAPDAGRYGLPVRNAIDSLLSRSKDDGTFGPIHDKYM